MKKHSMFAISLTLLALVGCAKNNPQMGAYQGSSTGIVNGEIVKSDDPVSKSVVGIYLSDASTGAGELPEQLCTGTLIDKDTVLTAAHCLEDDVAVNAKDFVIAFGTRVIKTKADLAQVVLRRGLKKMVHPQWNNVPISNPKTPMYDVGVLQIEQPAPEGYVPSAYAPAKQTLAKGTVLTAYGYGLIDGNYQTDTEVLRFAKMKVTNWNFSKTHFLVQDVASTCNGDSGGPAFTIDSNGQSTVVGITSFGPQSCDAGSYFTRVSDQSDWIKQTVEKFHQN